jgi:hypothetical protein
LLIKSVNICIGSSALSLIPAIPVGVANPPSVKPKNLLKNLIGGEKQRNDQEPPVQCTDQIEENPDSNLSPKKPLENLIKKGLNKILQ